MHAAMAAMACALYATVATAQVNQPIELPEFIVTGREKIDIPGGVKQSASKPAALGTKLLDSLNPTEKHPLQALPAKPLATPIRNMGMFPGYVDAEAGNYLTPRVLAGYTLTAGGYRIDLRGNAEGSDGWGANTSYTKFGLDALSTFVAPDKFIFFGGSTTEVDVSARMNSYNLYALPDAPGRDVTRLRAGVGVDGKYEDLVFQAGASYAMASVATQGREDASSNEINGYAAVEQRWSGIDAGARLDLRLPSLNGQGYPFVEASVRGRLHGETARIQLGGGVQTAESTTGVGRFGLLLFANADLFMGERFTLQLDGRSGLRPVLFGNLLTANPWIHGAAQIDHSYDVFDVRGTLVAHPTIDFMATAGIRIRRTDREVVWEGDSLGTFVPGYSTVSMMQIPVDMRWLVSARDAITADVTLTMTDVADAKEQPYVPNATASVGHDRQWTRELFSTLALVYVGDRWADRANLVQLTGYIDVRASVEYSITSAISVRVRAQNLLGSKITLWNGYLERGTFIAGGLTWKF